ncbi:hypothetical protein [Frankia sp. AgB32]|uniref:hypothetical protein n=1 Tax=Frankia sp. AgB32 TaxID=631119 RepID=UPI00200C40F2|nr:hypothetical protein [Frankia sp. AgB32]MCK9895664.1 hypothetical protein [Frankia sp. AgB32]
MAWIIIFGPPAVDGLLLREQYAALRTQSGKARARLRGREQATREPPEPVD